MSIQVGDLVTNIAVLPRSLGTVLEVKVNTSCWWSQEKYSMVLVMWETGCHSWAHADFLRVTSRPEDQ